MYAHYDHESDYVSSARFIRTLVQNPLLVRHLKSLKDIGPAPFGLGQTVEPYKRSASSIDCLCAVTKQLAPPSSASLILNMQRRKAILEFFQSGQDTVYGLEAVLILALASNIQEVALNWDSNPAYPRSGEAFITNRVLCLKMMTPGYQGFPCNQVHQFVHLRKLKVNMSGMRFSNISGILRLPSLVDLILFECKQFLPGPDLPKDTDWKCPAKESRVRTIRLDDFELHHSYLVKLVSSCQHLEAFALRVSMWCESPLDDSRFISELEQQHPELEFLRIIQFFDRIEDDSFDNFPTCFGSLRGFQNLRYLAAPLELLVSRYNQAMLSHVHQADMSRSHDFGRRSLSWQYSPTKSPDLRA